MRVGPDRRMPDTIASSLHRFPDRPRRPLGPRSPTSAGSATADRRLVLVAGTGRSGTSTLAGILRRLGLHVPQPEVGSDSTNPRGFGEPQWVVDFHDELLTDANVQVSDARPLAWERTGELAERPEVQQRLNAWLGSAVRPRRRRTDQGPAALVVPAAVDVGRPGTRRRALVRHHAPAAGRGGRQQAHLLQRPAAGRAGRRRLGEHDAGHRAGHARVEPGLRPVPRPARRLGARGQGDRQGARPRLPVEHRPARTGGDRRLRRSRTAPDRPHLGRPRPARTTGDHGPACLDLPRRAGLDAPGRPNCWPASTTSASCTSPTTSSARWSPRPR